jgi:GNAT superfamily N-acetyltransferase
MKLVRITNAEHREIATNLWFRIFTTEPFWVKKYAINELYQPRNRNNKPGQPYFIAYYKNKPVGITGIYRDKTRGKTYWLGWFGILPELQGKGLGSKVLEATIKELKNYHPDETCFYLWTDGGKDVQNFYKKNGFFDTNDRVTDFKTDGKIFLKIV